MKIDIGVRTRWNARFPSRAGDTSIRLSVRAFAMIVKSLAISDIRE